MPRFGNIFNYDSDRLGLGPSAAVWRHCAFDKLLLNANEGAAHYENWVPGRTFATGANNGGYSAYIDSGGSIQPSASILNRMVVATGTTIQDEAWLAGGGNIGGNFLLDLTKPRAFWYEQALQFSQIAAHAVFIGVGEPGLAAANTLVDATGALSDKDLFGFHVDPATPTILQLVYRKSGQAAVVVSADLGIVLVAGTEYKLGLRFNPNDRDNKYIRAFVDGVQVAEVDGNDISATTFPTAEPMTTIVGLKSTTAAAKSLILGWHAWAHTYDATPKVVTTRP